MKKLISTIVMCIFCTILFSQDTIVFKHTNYTSVWSNVRKYPYKVLWIETKAKVACEHPLVRKDDFAPDPLNTKATDLQKDYNGSGYDRGHNSECSANLCQTQQVQDECFYFSNMMPQPHCSNAGDWKSLETYTKQLATKFDSVEVWSGGSGCIKKFGKDSVNVPEKTWKVFYVIKTKTWGAYIFNNIQDKQVGIKPHEVQVKDVEKLTGWSWK